MQSLTIDIRSYRDSKTDRDEEWGDDVLPCAPGIRDATMVWHAGLLWVSYYSSHEGKTSIHLAKVKFRLED